MISTPAIRAANAERRLAKAEFNHRQSMDYINAALPLMTNPAVIWLGSTLFIEWYSNQAKIGKNWFQRIGPEFNREALETTLGLAFIAGSIGGEGIASIIKAIKL
jgi:hypothetical protein